MGKKSQLGSNDHTNTKDVGKSSTFRNRGHRNNAFPGGSSDTDSDTDDNGDNKKNYRGIRREDRVVKKGSGGSSKENFSGDSDGPSENEKRFGRNRDVKRHERHRKSSPSYESSRGRKKGYMKPDKYEGTTCFEIFLTQFSNCAEFNKRSESEKMAYLRWSLKGSAAQMLW